jgi:hypothetical protein
MDKFSVLQKSAANLTLSAADIGTALKDIAENSIPSNLRGARENPEDELLLSDSLLSLLSPPMAKLGFPIDPEPKMIYVSSTIRKKYYQIKRPEGFIALLFVRNKILEDASNFPDVAWIPLLFIKAGAIGIYLFSDSNHVDGSYKRNTEDLKKWGRIKEMRFLAAYVIAKLQASPDLDSRAIAIQEELEIDSIFAPVSPDPVAVLSIAELRNDQGQVQEIVKVVMGRLANPIPGTTTRGYLRYLILKTKLPNDLKSEYGSEDVWSGNPDVDAQNLIHKLIQLDLAIEDGARKVTALGCLLEALLDDLGEEERKSIEKIIAGYQL